MTTAQHQLLVWFVLLSLVCTIEVRAAPLLGEWSTAGLVHRAKRSLLWRWNTLKPVGASCREPSECGTKYCRRNVCSFRVFSS
ncbi:liver-expressed antimicrobial peptide 2-like [Osmerus eperlanus]|uniref:liver-expressed antimicrobial peptide 2-like n=1 Tax=Osmerus eperlanus TaxID=29151 RepID=UPI002E1206A7